MMNDITEEDEKVIKKHADICLNPGGIINRLNPSQLFEQEINFTSQIIRYRMSKMKTLKEKWEYLYKYVSYVNEREANEMKEFYNTLDKKEKEQFINENIYERIFINQEPFWNNISIDDLARIYEEFNIKKYDMKDITQPLVVGEVYFIRLKHEPKDKFSARSVGNNSFKDLPTKSRTFKDSKLPYSNTPIRLGEMEVTNLGGISHNGFEPIKQLLDSYANNSDDRKALITSLLTTNPFDPKIDFNNETVSNNLKILNATLAGMGIEIINNKGESNIKHLYNNDNYKHTDDDDEEKDYKDFIIKKFHEGGE
jgi:DNA-directed RNA polymerase beta subunit